MAKINHLNYLDIVDTIFSSSKNKGLTHIDSDESYFDGSGFLIRGKELKNFGTCGYLGLETHPKLAEGSIDLIKKYGTQFSMGRVFMRPKYIRELEELMGAIFNNNKVLCYTSTSTAHISVLANVIKPNDLIVLDQQVHFSVQFPAKNTKLQGTEIKMIRHSNFDMLEDILRNESNKFNKVWYLADGVYSMHGDFPDTERLQQLLDKYPKLHLYFDDAHGMSWYGKNGAGYVFDKLGVSKRIIVVSTLAKGFGCVGGTAVFYDEELYRKVDIFGGPHSYSHPLTPASAGAAIASAKIHLSSEIYDFQRELFDLTSHMDQLLKEKNLPNLSAPNSPIYYIGGGLNKVTHNFVNRILNEGFYVNTATFPAVPNDLSGLRFTITRHVNKSDIEEFVDAMAHHLPLAIEEENDDIERVYKDFNIKYSGLNKLNSKNDIKTDTLKVETYNSIKLIDKVVWNSVYFESGNFDYDALVCAEEIFSNNVEIENNWEFYYLLIKDIEENIVLATFFTSALIKDDMLFNENVSRKIEMERIKDSYYLCSKTLLMGFMFGEGDFLKVNRNHKDKTEAIEIMLNQAEKWKNESNSQVIILRDFETNDEFENKFLNEGFTKMNLPNSNVVKNPKWNNYDELLGLINSKRKKQHIKDSAIRKEKLFRVEIKTKLNQTEQNDYFKMFENVKDKNYSFNIFKYPSKIVSILSNYENWEFIELRIAETNDLAACGWCYKNGFSYTPLIVGLNYDFQDKYEIYKQLIFQTIKRGNDLDMKTVFLGYSADYEKQKYGAISNSKFAFVKFEDTYNLELIESTYNI
jgi:7-keto-8-aminopelargonate synthetase-like enzyme